MTSRWVGRLAALGIGAGALVCAVPASAYEGSTPPLPAGALPPSPPGDGATAERILGEIDAAVAKAPARAGVVAEPVRSARKALERAHGARTSGDTAHARLLDGLALEWAETARDLLRSADTEARAAKVARDAHETSTKLERARALLEETQARLGRAKAEVEKAEADAQASQKSAADAEAARVEKGTVAKPKKKPDAKDKGAAKKKDSP